MIMENKKELYMALIKARAAIGPIYKTSKAHRSKYAKLPDVLELIVPALEAQDLHLEQPTCDADEKGGTPIITRIVHGPTGQYTQSVFRLVIGDLNPGDVKEHKEAGIQTYHRRYQIFTLLGLCSEEDDQDGYRVDAYPQKQQEQPKEEKSDFISPAQVGLLRRELKGEKELEQAICNAYKIKDLSQLPWKNMQQVLEFIQKKINASGE